MMEDGTTSDPFTLGIETVGVANDAGIPLRLFGGQAVRFLTPDFPARTRADQDVDFASISSATDELIGLFKRLGYHADDRFNALYGHRQLYFMTPDGGASVDVVIDTLRMCHELCFAERIDRHPMTLDVTDLLLSKLQIVEINAKDMQDILYLLSAYEPREADTPDAISLQRFGEVIASDWGWWRTVTGSLEKLRALDPETLSSLTPPSPHWDAQGAIVTLQEKATEMPKSRRWRWRSKLGERVRWYELPEEEEH